MDESLCPLVAGFRRGRVVAVVTRNATTVLTMVSMKEVMVAMVLLLKLQIVVLRSV